MDLLLIRRDDVPVLMFVLSCPPQIHQLPSSACVKACVSFQTRGGPGWEERRRMDAADVRLLHRPRQHSESAAGGRRERQRHHQQRAHPADAGCELRERKHCVLSAAGSGSESV